MYVEKCLHHQLQSYSLDLDYVTDLKENAVILPDVLPGKKYDGAKCDFHFV
jgi:hypothetical protein